MVHRFNPANSNQSSHQKEEDKTKVVSRPVRLLSIALIDSNMLSRETLTKAAFMIQPLLLIAPYRSVGELMAEQRSGLDLIVFVAHGQGDGLEELSRNRSHFGDRRIVIVLDDVTIDAVPHLNAFRTHSTIMIDGKDTDLHCLIARFYALHYGRQNAAGGLETGMAKSAQPAFDASAVSLTPRERIVGLLISQGKSNKEIAAELNMSVSTVKAHIRNVMIKTGSNSRVQLALGLQKRDDAADCRPA